MGIVVDQRGIIVTCAMLNTAKGAAFMTSRLSEAMWKTFHAKTSEMMMVLISLMVPFAVVEFAKSPLSEMAVAATSLARSAKGIGVGFVGKNNHPAAYTTTWLHAHGRLETEKGKSGVHLTGALLTCVPVSSTHRGPRDPLDLGGVYF